jgi:hypothetical protein
LIAIGIPSFGLFEVEVMAWEDLKVGLQQNRTDFVADLARKYDCLVGFTELCVDLE